MGDRCFLHVVIRPKDVNVLARALGALTPNYKGEVVSWEPGDNGLVEIEIEEANYGCYEGLLKAASEGAAFIGWHTAGGEYSAQAFASDESSDAPCFVESGHSGGYVVQTNDDGKPCSLALVVMQAFIKTRDRVQVLHEAARAVVVSKGGKVEGVGR